MEKKKGSRGKKKVGEGREGGRLEDQCDVCDPNTGGMKMSDRMLKIIPALL